MLVYLKIQLRHKGIELIHRLRVQSGLALRLAELTDLMTGLQGQYYDANSALTEQKEALDQANEAAGAFEAKIERLNDVEDILTSGNQENAKSTEEMTSRMEGLIAEIETLEAAYNESYSAAMESINSQMGLFQEMDGSAKTSIDSLIDTLKGQVSYMETYNENIKKAMEMGVDQGLVKKLSDGSQESAQILDAIVKGGTEDIAALNEQFAKVEGILPRGSAARRSSCIPPARLRPSPGTL